MLCRVADSLYWIFRYIERAENLVRFLEVGWSVSLDNPSGNPSQWTSLIDACADRRLFEELHPTASPADVITFITRQPENPNAISNCIAIARENARQIRDTLPTDLFEELNALHLLLQDDPLFWHQRLPEQLQQIRRSCQTLYGLQNCTMQRDQSWLFANLGCLMERADKTARMLDVKYFLLLPSPEDVGGPLDELQWIALLRSLSGYQMFRRQQSLEITPARVAGFLLLNRQFPRSVSYCIEEIISTVDRIERSTANPVQGDLRQALEALRITWTTMPIEDLINIGLHQGIDHLQSQLNAVHGQLQQTYFTTSPCA
ncbi:MAG: alpha-E domain-containing protein [Cyanobacteriota bacterium]|jgi:uncharacterized alpha-E superfamily protein|nr:alpha-E domain-containing protein [Cyanobacteriota bacterium]NBQ36317.1 alpha-E domain-containing protein [Synechococcus sp.]